MSHAASGEHAQFRARAEHAFLPATRARGMLMDGGLSLAIHHRPSIPSSAENMLMSEVQHVTEPFDGGGLGVFPLLRRHNDLLVSPRAPSPDAGLLLGSSRGSSSERIRPSPRAAAREHLTENRLPRGSILVTTSCISPGWVSVPAGQWRLRSIRLPEGCWFQGSRGKRAPN